MSKKRKIGLGIIAIAVLVICYLIGQYVVGAKGSIVKKETYFDFVAKESELTYEGQRETGEAPGGKTVGVVEDETYGKYFLLTPGTSIRAGIILDDEERTLVFSYVIHSSVSNISDGMNLNVIVTAEDGKTVLYKENSRATDKEQVYELDLSEWKNSTVCIILSASNEDDENGDWLVVKDVAIQ